MVRLFSPSSLSWISSSPVSYPDPDNSTQTAAYSPSLNSPHRIPVCILPSTSAVSLRPGYRHCAASRSGHSVATCIGNCWRIVFFCLCDDSLFCLCGDSLFCLCDDSLFCWCVSTLVLVAVDRECFVLCGNNYDIVTAYGVAPVATHCWALAVWSFTR